MMTLSFVFSSSQQRFFRLILLSFETHLVQIVMISVVSFCLQLQKQQHYYYYYYYYYYSLSLNRFVSMLEGQERKKMAVLVVVVVVVD